MALRTSLKLADRFDQLVFNAICSRALVYNTCWEDPAVDRLALDVGSDDTMLVITSAGCNVLDYALSGPKRIHAVDANPRQSALIELKLAGIRRLEFDDFFAAFGSGYHPCFGEVYRDALRDDLLPFARKFWDKRVDWFQNPGGSFYYHGLSGTVAQLFRVYLKVHPHLAASIADLFDTRSLDEQRRIFDTRVQPLIWSRSVNWTLSQQLTMSLLGVPHPQRKEVQNQHECGVAGFVRDSVEYVFRQLPVWTNYFWSVYVRGCYTGSCCPEYLKRENFAALKTGLADRIRLHTSTVTEFLKATDSPISKFVLLDHMDWMSSYFPDALAEEWSYILRRATPNVRVVEADAATYRPDEPVDCVYFSYSLTMIPDWRSAMDNALAMLRPGGILGVVDFYVSESSPPPGAVRHGALTRSFWPRWFAHDGVRPTPEHPRRLAGLLPDHSLLERRGPIPYLPGVMVPYYLFEGRKPQTATLPESR